MHKILVLIHVLPPKISGSAIVVENLARQFSPKEMILAGGSDTPPDFSRDHNTGKQYFIISPIIKKHRYAKVWWYLEIPLVLIRVIRLIHRQKCTDIISVFPDETYLLVGYLASKITKTNLFPYFHNLYLENKHKFHLLFAEWLQPAVFRDSKHIFVMSDGMAELFREKYPGINCSALHHSTNLPIPTSEFTSSLHSPLRFVMSGSISESCQDAAIRMSQAVSQVPDAILIILTPTPISYLKSIGMVFDDKNVSTPLSQDSYMEKLIEADIILIPHGLKGERISEEYQTIFPTRLIEYLYSGLPILAHSPEGVYFTKFLRENQCAKVISEPSIPELLAAMEELRMNRDLRTGLLKNALKAAGQFSADNVSAYLRHVIAQ
jgi:glycosyltransferase involved in cell wall biosynthesis